MSTVESGPTEAERLFAGPGEVRRLCRARDWAATSLGAVDGWPQSLRTAVCMCQSAGLPMMVMWGPELVQIYNDAFVKVLGGRHPAGLGQPGRDCWPELWEMIGPMYQRVLDTGVPVYEEDLLFTPMRNGYPEEAWFTFSYSAIRDDGYRPAGIFVATVETTAQVRAQSARGSELELANERLREQAAELQAQAEELQATGAALAESEMRLRFAFTVAGLGPWDLDLVRGGSWRSPRHDEIFGYHQPLAEWTYEDFLAHVHPGDRESVAERFGRALETAAAWDFVCRIVRAGDGEVRWIHGRGEPVLGADGRPVRLIGIVRDVTEAHRAEAALRGARDEAEAANRAKSEFLAVMSHELRTPLNAIAGYAELLALGIHGPVNQGQVEALERISYSQKHLLKLINDVLNLARIEA
ncbi:MAG TPA: histidine kinase dimerization/phospho-acceptor domain-containing protein, partial [Longimicrobium sp.]